MEAFGFWFKLILVGTGLLWACGAVTLWALVYTGKIDFLEKIG